MKKLLKFGALCASFALLATGAQAAVIATLTFDQPTGIVSPTDPVPVYVILTLSADSDALTTDASGQVTSGLSDQDITDAGYDPALMTRRIVNNAFECGGTFNAVCTDPPPYSFDFNFAAPSFVGAANLDLQPGSSTQFLFGTFNPAGSAPAGLYTFYNAIFEFEFYDPNITDPNVHPQSITIANTCSFQDDACAFTREVVGGATVPEPMTWAMLLLGFGGIGAMLRSDRRREAPVGA